MRQIHPVGFHEKFVASGAYTYQRGQNHKPGDALENWTIHQLSDGGQIIRVDWESKADYWVSLIEAWQNPIGNVDRFDIKAYNTDDIGFRQLAATCIRHENDGIAEVAHTIDGFSFRREVEIPANCTFDPGAALFRGLKIGTSVLGRNIEIPVLTCIPQLIFSPPANQALRIKLDNFSAYFVGNEKIQLSNKEYETWHYTSVKRYETSAMTAEYIYHWWVDQYKILLRYEIHKETSISYAIYLTQYSRRPEPPKS